VDLTVKDGGAEAQQVIGAEELLAMRAAARSVPVASGVQEYALRLVLATHPENADAPEVTKKYLRFGASPRAAQALLSVSRVRALAKGRFNVAFEDIRVTAPACLRHRIALNFEAISDGKDVENVLGEIISNVSEK
jgi:MoxR-like ATPase